MSRIEPGAIEFTAEFKGGALVSGSPKIQVLRDGISEVAESLPDGKYKWVLVLGIDKAERVDLEN